MRTSLNKIKLIEGYIFNVNQPLDALLFDAMLILDPAFREQVNLQKKVHTIVLQYSRKKLRTEIDSVHKQLFDKPEHRSFRWRILDLFKKH
jgi:hypothetical protein